MEETFAPSDEDTAAAAVVVVVALSEPFSEPAEMDILVLQKCGSVGGLEGGLLGVSRGGSGG